MNNFWVRYIKTTNSKSNDTKNDCMMREENPVTTVVAQPGDVKGVKNFKAATEKMLKKLKTTSPMQNNINRTAMVSACTATAESPCKTRLVKFILLVPANLRPRSKGMLVYGILDLIIPPEKWFQISET